jgi:cell division initiation protein
MKLTPLDIRHKEFKRGMRGYVDGEVDEFLDEVADEFERLFKENIDLSERGEGLQEKLDQYRNLEETLQNTLVAAQRSAEELKANAQKEAQLMLSEAELKAREMVNQSYADKQAVEKQIVVLKAAEEDFRFKFRSLLDAYAKQLTEADATSKKAAQFAGQGDQIRDAMARDAAARPAPASMPAAGAPVPPPPRPAGLTEPAPQPVASAPTAGPAVARDEAPAAAEAGRPGPARNDDPAPAGPRGGNEPGKAPAPPAERSDATAAAQPRAPFLGDADDLLSDVDGEIDENAFKW